MMYSSSTKVVLDIVIILWISVMVRAEKNDSVPSSVEMMLVGTLQNQLKTCMDQNADLVRRSCSATDDDRGVPHENIGRHVAFHAGLSKSVENLPHNYKVIFDRIYLNEGKGYDHHTGVFSCPVGGIYVFDWTIMTKPGKYFYTELMINGKVVGRSHLISASVHRSASSMVVQKLRKGDKVWIEPHESHTGEFARADWCFFSGFKI